MIQPRPIISSVVATVFDNAKPPCGHQPARVKSEAKIKLKTMFNPIAAAPMNTGVRVSRSA
jgi:hypothetical protein